VRRNHETGAIHGDVRHQQGPGQRPVHRRRGGGLVILSFLDWYSFSFSGLGSELGADRGYSLWNAHYGILKLALLLAVVAGVLVLGRLMEYLEPTKLPVGVNVLTLFASGAATLIFLLRMVTSYKSENLLGTSVSAHPAYGWYLGLAVSAAMTYFAYRNVTASGESIPGLTGTSSPPPADPPMTAP
jgi:hypothetical protein